MDLQWYRTNIAKKPYIFVIFREGGPDPLSPPLNPPLHGVVKLNWLESKYGCGLKLSQQGKRLGKCHIIFPESVQIAIVTIIRSKNLLILCLILF